MSKDRMRARAKARRAETMIPEVKHETVHIPDEVLGQLAQVPEVVNELWPDFDGRICVPASAVGQRILARASIRAGLRTVYVAIGNPETGTHITIKGESGRQVALTHLVLTVGDHLLDLSVGQYSRPQYGLTMPSMHFAKLDDFSDLREPKLRRAIAARDVDGGFIFYFAEPSTQGSWSTQYSFNGDPRVHLAVARIAGLVGASA